MTHAVTAHRTVLLVGTVLLLLAAVLMFAATGDADPARMPGSICPPMC